MIRKSKKKLYQRFELTESQISIFIVQSGPIRRSLVAFSTATVAEEEEEEAIAKAISISARKGESLRNFKTTVRRRRRRRRNTKSKSNSIQFPGNHNEVMIITLWKQEKKNRNPKKSIRFSYLSRRFLSSSSA